MVVTSKAASIVSKSLSKSLIRNGSPSSLMNTADFLVSQRKYTDGRRGLTAIPMAKKEGYNEDRSLGSARYGGRYTVSMLPGDGIGPEMMGYVKDIFREVGAPVDFETVELDPTTDNYDDLHNAISSVKRNGCAIKGNIDEQIINQPHIKKSRNVEIRNALDLFVNVLHCKSVEGVKTRHDNVDVVVVRQNTEGEYAMVRVMEMISNGKEYRIFDIHWGNSDSNLETNYKMDQFADFTTTTLGIICEHENVPGVVESLKVVTEKNTERLCRFAFDYARENGRKKVTVVHKANIMKLTDGLFLATGEKVAREYPDIEFNNMIIDNCCMQLVSNPWQFDVVVLTNLYGTIVSNLLCGLIGGPGLTSGRNLGPTYAIFEPGTRNAGSSLVGKNIANPTAMLKAGVDLLRHLDLENQADIVERSINKTLIVDEVRTADLGGSNGTSEVVENVLRHVKESTK